MADLTPTIAVKPLALHIGAEISGIDLDRPLDVATRNAVNDALLRWKVVFFRGQHLDHRGHVAFARQMGEPTIGHAVFGHIRGFPRDLLGRQGPHRSDLSGCAPAATVDRMGIRTSPPR